VRRILSNQVSAEALDGREPAIPGSHAVAASSFQVVKKCENPVFSDVIETKLRHVHSFGISEVTEEQLKTVSVGKECMSACSTRPLQVLAEE
jgi:hypothetical protein